MRHYGTCHHKYSVDVASNVEIESREALDPPEQLPMATVRFYSVQIGFSVKRAKLWNSLPDRLRFPVKKVFTFAYVG